MEATLRIPFTPALEEVLLPYMDAAEAPDVGKFMVGAINADLRNRREPEIKLRLCRFKQSAISQTPQLSEAETALEITFAGAAAETLIRVYATNGQMDIELDKALEAYMDALEQRPRPTISCDRLRRLFS